jgi:hypothetical protein
MGAATAAIGAARTRAQNLMNKIRGGAADVASGISNRAQALIGQAQGIADAIQPKISDLTGRIDALLGRSRGNQSPSQIDTEAAPTETIQQPSIIQNTIRSVFQRGGDAAVSDEITYNQPNPDDVRKVKDFSDEIDNKILLMRQEINDITENKNQEIKKRNNSFIVQNLDEATNIMRQMLREGFASGQEFAAGEGFTRSIAYISTESSLKKIQNNELSLNELRLYLSTILSTTENKISDDLHSQIYSLLDKVERHDSVNITIQKDAMDKSDKIKKNIKNLKKEKMQAIRDLYRNSNPTPIYRAPDNPGTGENSVQIAQNIAEQIRDVVKSGPNDFMANVAIPYIQSLSLQQQMEMINDNQFHEALVQSLLPILSEPMYRESNVTTGLTTLSPMFTNFDENRRIQNKINELQNQIKLYKKGESYLTANDAYVDYPNEIQRLQEELMQFNLDDDRKKIASYGFSDDDIDILQMHMIGTYPNLPDNITQIAESIGKNKKANDVVNIIYRTIGNFGHPEARLAMQNTVDAERDMRLRITQTVENSLQRAMEYGSQYGEDAGYQKFIESIMQDHAKAGYSMMTAHIHQLFTQIGQSRKINGVAPNFFPDGITPPAPHPQAVAWMQRFYEEQQGLFAIQGVTEIPLLRGTHFELGLPFESWTSELSTAEIFQQQDSATGGANRENGVIYQETIPVQYIWGTYETMFGWDEAGVRGKKEHVVLGWLRKIAEENEPENKTTKEPKYQAIGSINLNEDVYNYDIYTRWYADTDYMASQLKSQFILKRLKQLQARRNYRKI